MECRRMRKMFLVMIIGRELINISIVCLWIVVLHLIRKRHCSSDTKKSMSADKLAEPATVDPKHAKRIWANRQSAAISKERKMRYITELERKVQTLKTEAMSLSAQLPLLQRDAHGLTVENSELKLRLQTMEQQGAFGQKVGHMV